MLLKETRAVFRGAEDQVWPVQGEEVDHKLERRLPEDVLWYMGVRYPRQD